jgi:hypothetical protein
MEGDTVKEQYNMYVNGEFQGTVTLEVEIYHGDIPYEISGETEELVFILTREDENFIE